MDVVELTKKLISIPSYVDGKVNEKKLADFIYEYIKRFPFLTEIKKQKVEGSRYNIIASDGAKPKLLLAGHMDTVEPRGWRNDPFKPWLKGSRLYGLGSMDMKGGIAAILAALTGVKQTNGLSLLFYCDEEYDFKGMAKFVKERKAGPKIAVVTEPTNLKIWNGARGIIKISIEVLGQTAPASRPDKGRNAITGLVAAVEELANRLAGYKNKNLGASTCNLASISGGLAVEKRGYGFEIDSKGDAVPNIARAGLDIRGGSCVLTVEVIKKILADNLKKNGFRLNNFKVLHNLGTFYSATGELRTVELAIKGIVGKAEYLNLQQMGYQDIQMLNKKFKTTAFSFGPVGGNRHQPDEWVDIRSLVKTREVCQKLIEEFCSI